MKKLFILFILILNSCSSDTAEQNQPDATCYPIIARGSDLRGDYIIINYSNYNQKRYLVDDYMQYINQSKLCEPITLIEQPL